MRTSEQIKAEITDKFGFFPPFFEPALDNSQVLENLWQQTLIAYVNNPLSALFKEKLSAYLSRFCSVPYCMVSHSCTLRPLGMKAKEVLQLLESPSPNENDVEEHLRILAAHPNLQQHLPAANSPLEESLLVCSIFIFLEGEAAQPYRHQVHRLLGKVNYQHIAAFVAYVKTCHVWMEANPEVSYEADKRVQDHLGALVADEPGLIEFFSNYREKVRKERQNRAIQLAEMAERLRNQEALQQSEEKYRKLVELSPETIFVQFEGKFVFINSAGLKLFGASSAEQLIGKKILDFIHPDYHQIVSERMQQLIAGNSVPRIEEKMIRLDRTLVDVEVAASTLTYNGKTATQVVVRDISDRKQLEATLQQQAEELKQANQSKDEFMAVLSHELRSPLNAMLGWAQLLRTRKFDAATTAKALEAIERNAQAQSQLIEDLLDISRIVRGKISLKMQPVNLESVITSALDTVHLAADAKSIQLEFLGESGVRKRAEGAGGTWGLGDKGTYSNLPLSPHHSTCHLPIPPSPPHSSLLVLGDIHRLQQVVSNLLTNAIKFTPSGGRVEIRLSKVELAIQKQEFPIETLSTNYSLPITNYAQIQVTDTGIGIKSEFLPHVFDRFHQANTNSSRSHGLGLGLSIVRQLVELHGGSVWAESQGEGQGSTFTVNIPLLERAGGAGVAGGAGEDSTSSLLTPDSCILANIRVLVVDDEADARDYIATVLQQSGAEAKSVTSVTQALATLTQWQPDLLVSDIAMPEQDGYTLIRQVRSLAPEQGGRIPAVALTAYAMAEDRDRALAAGFQLHISKPVEPSQLTFAIAQLIATKKRFTYT